MEYKDVTDLITGVHGLLDKLEVRVRKSRISRFFWHSVRVKWYTPPVILGTSWELDPPNRKGRTVILRYSWDKSIVLGFWGKTGYDEDHALLNATIYGRERTREERDAWDESIPKTRTVDGIDCSLLEGRPGLRVRATVDAGTDGQ